MQSSTDVPPCLYRFRSLDGQGVFEREMDALENSYLYAPAFKQMNDPMEAFYRMGVASGLLLKTLHPGADDGLAELEAQFARMIEGCGLISMASRVDNLPMWAYYAGNFKGMCLEFDSSELEVGDLQNEPLRSVRYEQDPAPALELLSMFGDSSKAPLLEVLTRKHCDWSHEGEWRYVTGSTGKKHFLDDALRRVFLGPLVAETHVERILQVLARRPVEVLKGRIDGYHLRFETIQRPAPGAACQRVGSGAFTQNEDLYARSDLEAFLRVPFESLVDLCRRLASRPNMNGFSAIDLSGHDRSKIYISTRFKLRSGREVYNKRLFNADLKESFRHAP